MGNGSIGGLVDNSVGGMGSERECMLGVSDAVVRREGTETMLIKEYWSCGEVYGEIGSGEEWWWFVL